MEFRVPVAGALCLDACRDPLKTQAFPVGLNITFVANPAVNNNCQNRGYSPPSLSGNKVVWPQSWHAACCE